MRDFLQGQGRRSGTQVTECLMSLTQRLRKIAIIGQPPLFDYRTAS